VLGFHERSALVGDPDFVPTVAFGCGSLPAQAKNLLVRSVNHEQGASRKGEDQCEERTWFRLRLWLVGFVVWWMRKPGRLLTLIKKVAPATPFAFIRMPKVAKRKQEPSRGVHPVSYTKLN